jgi:hypothetical protein
VPVIGRAIAAAGADDRVRRLRSRADVARYPAAP